MEHKSVSEAPQLVKTAGGFSVFYRNTYLYSKYNAARTHEKRAEALSPAENTLILCFSPVLGYGLKTILQKLPSSSFLLCLEYDEALFQLFTGYTQQTLQTADNYTVLYTKSISDLIRKIENLPLFPFKQVLCIEGSAGTFFYRDFYENAETFAREAVKRYWVNKATLIHLGKKYARNFFANYKEAAKNLTRFKKFPKKCLSVPILVAAAGPGLDKALPFIKKNRDSFFLLAVDAALPALAPEIIPDAVVLLESQVWITPCFIGFTNSKIPLFADLTAFPQAVNALSETVYFFFTKYTKARWLDRLQRVGETPAVFPPLGSVGLTALQIALALSENDMPIFYTGLNFSWGKAATHAKKAPQTRTLYNTTDRFYSLYPENTVFPLGYQHMQGIQNTVTTTPNLLSYAKICDTVFGQYKNLYNLDTEGILFKNKRIDFNTAEKILASAKKKGNKLLSETEESVFNEKIKNFFSSEKKRLIELKAIFTGVAKDDPEKVKHIIKESDYLYLHFPDVTKISDRVFTDVSFLKRVRIEIDSFIKTCY
ncbi:6-hydroxymethylpterin diphosphokinase MptE-like protein [Treponema phagedenis]|uniref:6-hydroxymethylpterin diphosphokinase MptE-like protein n=1 Tax=Treponema phagedenis TaxID=162 RepID=UPI0001F6378C|nr:6-hydroxymethylpterin diphosphokinase MptE-like protein [Treponema phagedenis]EFW36913.1 hypothetical protein HMPREF9554_02613 [Treponema phagedenis F0421]TYT76702.1 motility associated factor glycosyltransferase family protein [Treponema phagedenis]